MNDGKKKAHLALLLDSLLTSFSKHAYPAFATTQTNSKVPSCASPFTVSSTAADQSEGSAGRNSASRSGFVVDSYLPRAGEDGFSVLRKPMTRSNWDPYSPVELDDVSYLQVDGDSKVRIDRAAGQQDAEWWQASKRNSVNQFLSSKKEAESSEEQTQSPEDDLDLFQRSLNILDYPKVLQALILECSTVPAKRIVQQSMRTQQIATGGQPHPLLPRKQQGLMAYQGLAADHVEGARARYRAVRELQWIVVDGKTGDQTYRDARGYKQLLGPPPLHGVRCDVEALFGPPSQPSTVARVLDADDITQVRDLMDAMQTVLNWGEALRKAGSAEGDIEFEELPLLAETVVLNTTLSDLLHSAFEQNVRSGHEHKRLSGVTFPILNQLRSRVQALRGEVLSILDGLLALPSTQSRLALDSGGSLYSEVAGRLVIPVQSKYASMGIIHDTSRSGKTVYVEPTEIVSITNELKQAEAELRAEEGRIWRMLSSEVFCNQHGLESSAYSLGQLDLVHAKFQLGLKLGGVIPEVQSEGIVSVRNAKHPVLLLRQLEVVGSTIELGADGNQGLVLTGPNSGGKTIVLKLLGLLAHMARAGIPLPVDPHRPRVDFFDPILADIGDLQSVGGDLSTFSGHMLVCREILRNARQNSLVLCDELGTGTDPNQGVALAQAILEDLLEAGCRVAITTHFLQLKQLATSDPRFAVGGMQFINGKPTYKLLPGTVGESFALSVAERLELPRRVVDRAAELMDSDTLQMGDLIRELEDQKILVDQEGKELEIRRRDMANLEQQLRDEMARLERKQLQVRREEAKKFARMLEEKEKVLETILEKLKSDPSRRVVAKSWEEIKCVKRDALVEAEMVSSALLQKRKADDELAQFQAELVPIADVRDRPALEPGDKVVVCRKGPLLGREATITKNLGGRVEVSVNNMNVGLRLTEVALPTKGKGNDFSTSLGKNSPSTRAMSKAAERALREERAEKRDTSAIEQSDTISSRSKSSIAIRTESNTVDVRGCTLDEAKTKGTEAFSRCLMSGRSVVYILHGHGTGGVLKAKIRSWLQSERSLVRRYLPADRSDGGDAFTRVELR